MTDLTPHLPAPRHPPLAHIWGLVLCRTGGFVASALLVLATSLTSQAEPWKFGVIADTQWVVDEPPLTLDDGYNPNTVAAGIIRQIDLEFIREGVKLVISVGDTMDQCWPVSIGTRALYCQDLYNAGIGFFPLRGNHEGYEPWYAPDFFQAFPQMTNGVNNATPDYIRGTNWGHDTFIDPVPNSNSTFTVGANFSFPTNANQTSGGLTYSFDYENVRFVMIDQFMNTDPEALLSTVPALQPWLTESLADGSRPLHGLVFAHKMLLGQAHKDNLFGDVINDTDPGDGCGMTFDAGQEAAEQEVLSAKQQAENAFINSLATNRVRLFICGHDHGFLDSIVTCPDGSASVRQIISQGASSKFYWAGPPFSTNSVPVCQDLLKVGYYIYTVDGPQVNVDYYAVPISTSDGFITNTPALTGHLQKYLTFGYSLNGREFLVPQGASYSGIADDTTEAVAQGETGYAGTSMRILAGQNGSTVTTVNDQPLTKALNTGWSPATNTTLSDILTLWGLLDLGATQTDTYVLSLGFQALGVSDAQLASGLYVLAARDAGGSWVNAVYPNAGGTPRFVNGPWQSAYPLGTYGIDAGSHTAWAVINHAGAFAVALVPPALTATLSGGFVQLSWPSSLASGPWQLQFSPDVAAPNWTILNTNRVAIGQQGFFRLFLP